MGVSETRGYLVGALILRNPTTWGSIYIRGPLISVNRHLGLGCHSSFSSMALGSIPRNSSVTCRWFSHGDVKGGGPTGEGLLSGSKKPWQALAKRSDLDSCWKKMFWSDC